MFHPAKSCSLSFVSLTLYSVFRICQYKVCIFIDLVSGCVCFIFQFGARKMDWMAPRVEDLLEEALTEAEEAVAEAEVTVWWGDD